ncbi:hypothetical protein V5T82_11190 [Magnetovibrio sp. PR-2]|uniref:hypothetical protein n=1 Tax=Magnetovibrio sp. PR-2 TaxID=3120356 RepID=UPI002FCE0166
MANFENSVIPNIQSTLRTLDLPAENQSIIDIHKDRLQNSDASDFNSVKLYRGYLTNVINHSRYVTEKLAFDIVDVINYKLEALNDNILRAADEVLIFDTYIANFAHNFENFRNVKNRFDKDALEQFYDQTTYTHEVTSALVKEYLVPRKVASQIMSIGLSSGFRNLELVQVNGDNGTHRPIPLNGGGTSIIESHKTVHI